MPIAYKVQPPDILLQWEVTQERVRVRKVLTEDLCPKSFFCWSSRPLDPRFACQKQAVTERTFANRHSNREVVEEERPWVSIRLGVLRMLDRNSHLCAVALGIVSKRSVAK